MTKTIEESKVTRENYEKGRWIEEDTGKQFFTKQDLNKYIQEEYKSVIEELILDFLDDEYRASDVYEAIGTQELTDAIEELRNKAFEHIIETFFIG